MFYTHLFDYDIFHFDGEAMMIVYLIVLVSLIVFSITHLMFAEAAGLLEQGEILARFGRAEVRLGLGCFVGRLLGSGYVLVIDCVCVCCSSMMILNKISIIKPFCLKRQRRVVCFFLPTSDFFKHLQYS